MDAIQLHAVSSGIDLSEGERQRRGDVSWDVLSRHRSTSLTQTRGRMETGRKNKNDSRHTVLETLLGCPAYLGSFNDAANLIQVM